MLCLLIFRLPELKKGKVGSIISTIKIFKNIRPKKTLDTGELRNKS